MAMTSAEKQRAYRRRKAVEGIAKSYFNGRQYLTVAEFREALDFDEREFWNQLDGYGEEKSEITEERKEVWDEAYKKAYADAYDEALKEAYETLGTSDDEETDQEAEENAAQEAAEIAKEEADEAVKSWEEELADYDETCWEYALADLLDAQRAASVPPLG